MKFGLPEKTIKIINDYFAKLEYIEIVKIYGSRATGHYHNGSDIDLAIFFNSSNKNDFISKISLDLFELDTPYKFDVVDYNSLTNFDLKKEIDDYGIVFYTRDKKDIIN
jgi:uncharacterized protein